MSYRHTSRRVIRDEFGNTQPIAGIRAATKAASQAAGTAASTAAGYGENAAGIGSSLVPQLQADVAHPQGFSPEESNAMLVSGLEGAGGAAGGIAGEAALQAARSRNVGGMAGALDEAARERMRTSAAVGLDVAGKNAMAKQAQRSSALKELGGLYGTDVEAQLKAQGLVPEDINAWSNANKTGWVQNVDQTLASLSGAGYKGAGGGGFTL